MTRTWIPITPNIASSRQPPHTYPDSPLRSQQSTRINQLHLTVLINSFKLKSRHQFYENNLKLQHRHSLADADPCTLAKGGIGVWVSRLAFKMVEPLWPELVAVGAPDDWIMLKYGRLYKDRCAFPKVNALDCHILGRLTGDVDGWTLETQNLTDKVFQVRKAVNGALAEWR